MAAVLFALLKFDNSTLYEGEEAGLSVSLLV